jgi:putative colanic acid biosynthesis acetyltransferase WcaF
MTRPSTAPTLAPSSKQVDVSGYSSHFGLGHKAARASWRLVWMLLFRPSPVFMFGWRRMLLRAFGARMGTRAVVYPSTRIWAPWHLEMGAFACLGPHSDCYCVDRVTLGAHATVSQSAVLCTASHDITDPGMRLMTAPIVLGDGAWVAQGAFIHPGRHIGEGAVVAARACVIRDVAPWEVVGGNPAVFLKMREIKSSQP